MEFTIDATVLWQALKRVDVGLVSYPMTIAPYVLLSARNGNVAVKVFCKSLHICVDLSTGIEIAQEGEYAADHKRLLKTLQAFQGPVTLKRHERGIVVFSDTNGVQQISVEGRVREDWLQTELLETVGATYTRSEYVQSICDGCRQPHPAKKISTYRIQHVEVQQARLQQQDLARLVEQVVWVASDEHSVEPVQKAVCIALDQDLFSLAACGNYCATLATQAVPGAGSWKQCVLLPAGHMARAIKALPKGEQVLIEARVVEQQLVTVNGQEEQGAPPFTQLLTVRLIAGNVTAIILPMQEKIPNYRSIFPEAYQTRILCPKDKLLQALTVLVPIAKESFDELVFHIGSPLKLVVEQKPAPALCEVFVLEQEGQDWSVILTALDFFGAVKALSSLQVILEMSELDKPFLVLRESGNGSSYACVIKPKSVRNRA